MFTQATLKTKSEWFTPINPFVGARIKSFVGASLLALCWSPCHRAQPDSSCANNGLDPMSRLVGMPGEWADIPPEIIAGTKEAAAAEKARKAAAVEKAAEEAARARH